MRTQRNKFERVRLPQYAGINAENSVLVRSVRELKTSEFVKKRDEFSVRTFYRDDRKDFGLNKKAPHLCTTTKTNLFRRAPGLFEEGLWLIVADQVDSKDCECRGTIWVMNSGVTLVEIAYGPGTVRTVTNDGEVDERHMLEKSELSLNKNLNYCVAQCRSTELRAVIFEFSYYKIPIGWKNEKFICWEITDDGTHQCRLFKE